MLPRLATYLGHTDPEHTFWYLPAAPELMALAEQRLDAHLGPRRQRGSRPTASGAVSPRQRYAVCRCAQIPN